MTLGLIERFFWIDAGDAPRRDVACGERDGAQDDDDDQKRPRIVRADSEFTQLQETFGGRIGWTVAHSQSGYNAVRHHLLRYEGPPPLYRDWVGPLVTPRRVIEAVLADEIDVGPLDSYVHQT